MKLEEFILKVFRKIVTHFRYHHNDPKLQGDQFFGYVQLYDQEANDYVYHLLSERKPCMVSKFGTIELGNLVLWREYNKGSHSISDYVAFIKGKLPTVNWLDEGTFSGLCSNAGFFPKDISLLSKYYQINLDAMKQIDVLGSYIRNEDIFKEELQHAKRVNLDGYYAPFYWKHPWTKALEGKKVLVVHPFAEDIQNQYQDHRTQIWKDPELLPEFELITYKSVQSMLGIKTDYATWFDALKKMEDDIAKIDFDIALIGCGAYGMPLAAYCKSLGKQAIHLAGWTQVLFGIIGTRWQNNPRVAPMMNEYWIHPSKANIPTEAKKIENGAYW